MLLLTIVYLHSRNINYIYYKFIQAGSEAVRIIIKELKIPLLEFNARPELAGGCGFRVAFIFYSILKFSVSRVTSDSKSHALFTHTLSAHCLLLCIVSSNLTNGALIFQIFYSFLCSVVVLPTTLQFLWSSRRLCYVSSSFRRLLYTRVSIIGARC
jgi:hypothetical protein